MITRKISAVIRGKATPFQITAACLLGSMIGFVPTFSTARGLMVALLLLLLILNANLLIATTAAAIAKAIALLITPVTFATGRLLLDGPTEGLFRSAVNAPVLALFGLEYYLTTGGIVMGAVLGIVLAFVLIRTLGTFRKRMAKIEESSERYKKLTSKTSVRLLTFILIGKGKGKKTYEQLLGKKIGNPIRIVGVAVAVLAIALLFIGRQFMTERILTAGLVRGLERANGATVDLESASLSLKDQKLVLTGLAIADPSDLGTDSFRSATLEADVDATDLLRARLTLDQVTVTDASHGAKRAVPGRLIETGKAQPTPPAPPPAPTGSKSIDDYLAEAEKWRDRIDQLRELLDRVQGRDPDAEPTDPSTPKETDAERMRRLIAMLGYARVRADHLIEGSPTLLVRTLDVNGITTGDESGRVYDVHAEDVSTHPWLTPNPAQAYVKSQDGTLDASFVLDETVTFEARLTNLNADEVAAGLSTPEPLMRGGALDATITGSIGPGPMRAIDLPLVVNLHDTELKLPNIGSSDVREFTLTIGVLGSLSDPQIFVDPDALAQALSDAGANELAGLLNDEIKKALGDVAPDVGELGGDLEKKANEALKGLLGGG